jgi:hypothetical protein
VIGVGPVQLPAVAVSVDPANALPETAGARVLTGDAPVTGGVAAELADTDPPALVAVTTTMIVSPTSLGASEYVELAAPPMLKQPLAPVPQSCHW